MVSNSKPPSEEITNLFSYKQEITNKPFEHLSEFDETVQRVAKKRRGGNRETSPVEGLDEFGARTLKEKNAKL